MNQEEFICYVVVLVSVLQLAMLLFGICLMARKVMG